MGLEIPFDFVEMRTSTSLAIIASSLVLLFADLHVASAQNPVRYRGTYTLGHEVNSFCPDINSQCYWLSGETPGSVRDALRQNSGGNQLPPYEPVCIVIKGIIDRSTTREGFAASYDGLITVSKLIDLCAESTLVIESDLQHHRWVLDSMNGEALPGGKADQMVPELDFGEQMHVTGNDGCNRFSGKAVLSNEFFLIEPMVSTRRSCTPLQKELESAIQAVLGREPTILQDENKNLTLESNGMVLRFRLQDWTR